MISSDRVARNFAWVEGSPSAAENPPRDRQWRAAVAAATRGLPPADHVELDFLLEQRRVVIDLDNLVRLALDGLRDSGTLRYGLVGLDTLLATKRTGAIVGLGVTAASAVRPFVAIHDSVELEVTSEVIPREDRNDEKHAWRNTVRATWSGDVLAGPVALDVAVRSTKSIGALMKPVIDGLEPFLGRGTIGRGEFRPLDERIVVLRVRREAGLATALRVVAGPPASLAGFRTAPPAPALPEMDPAFPYSTSDLEAIKRRRGWEEIFSTVPQW